MARISLSPKHIFHGPVDPHPLQGKTLLRLTQIGCALAIIAGVGGVALAGTGLFRVGVLSHLSQASATTLAAASGSVGIALLGGGLAASVYTRNLKRQERLYQEQYARVDTQGGKVYGPDVWKLYGVEIVEEPPPQPDFDWEAIDPHFKKPYHENYMLFYFPDALRLGKKEFRPSFTSLQEHLQWSVKQKEVGSYIQDSNLTAVMQSSSQPGWFLISREVICEEYRENPQQFLEAGFQRATFPQAYLAMHLFMDMKKTGEKFATKDNCKIDRITCLNPADHLISVLAFSAVISNDVFASRYVFGDLWGEDLYGDLRFLLCKPLESVEKAT